MTTIETVLMAQTGRITGDPVKLRLKRIEPRQHRLINTEQQRMNHRNPVLLQNRTIKGENTKPGHKELEMTETPADGAEKGAEP